MYKKIILILTILNVGIRPGVFSQKEINNYIYSIRITVNNKQFIQTGFRLSGTRGIITALHGVVGAQEITAVNEAGSVFLNLKIIKTDISKDAAVLYSDKMAALSTDGLIAIGTNQVGVKENLKVIGHPQGISLIVKSVTAGTPFLKQLNSFIPPDKAALFERRNSPNPFINVMYVEGNLVPGHSGAPVLNYNNRVVGIVNGGILGGLAGICWAIPVTDVNLSADGIPQKLLPLYPQNLNLFTFQSLDSNVTPGTKQYVVDYFEISGLRPVNFNYQLNESNTAGLINTEIKAGNKNLIKLIADSLIRHYLAGDSGAALIKRIMSAYWNNNNYGKTLTFPQGTSLNMLQQWSREEAIEKHAIGFVYDHQLCSIEDTKIEYTHSDFSDLYTGKIKIIKLRFHFSMATASNLMHGIYSDEELDAKETNWTKFVVIKMEQRYR